MLHEILLTPEPASAERARRFVASHLRRYGFEDLKEPVTLCTSELVTNAVLHAGTEVAVRLRVARNSLRVEVRDHSRAPVPVAELETVFEATRAGIAANETEAAITGRGWMLISTLASRYGVAEQSDGKIAWFEIAIGAEEGGLTSAEIVNRKAEPPPPPADYTLVQMIGVPPRLVLHSEQHLADLIREAQLALPGPESASAPPGGDIASVMQDILDRYAGVRSVGWSQAVEAASEGRERITIELPLPREAEEDARKFARALEDADELCRRGALLVMPAPEELVSFRRWFLDEVIAQLGGRTPRPCPFDP